MAHRASLHSELVSCERELSILGAGIDRESDVVSTFKKTLAEFVSKMDMVTNSVQLIQVKIATKLWASVFHRFNNRFNELEAASPRDTDTRTYAIIDESCLMMELIATAFKETGGPLYDVTSQMRVGLTRDAAGSRPMVTVSRCAEFMSAMFEKLGRCMRQLQCKDARYYDFLGTDAKKVMVSIFDLLDPTHDVKPDIRDSESDVNAVRRFE